jgi:uncharacterized protein
MTRPTTRSLAELQRQFAAHIRDPDHQAVPDDVSPRRMRVYTELFYRNIEQLLAGGFPVIRRILPDDEWHALVRDFMVRHRCRTPLFTAVGQEFVAFLSSHDSALAARPFLAELARHEQLEVEAALAEDPEPRATPDAEATPGAERWRSSIRLAAGAFRAPGLVSISGAPYRSRVPADDAAGAAHLAAGLS